MTSNQIDRNDYNVGASQSVQSNFENVAARLEAALQRRDQDVRAALADYQADGVSEEYAALEQQWTQAGDQVRGVIAAIRGSLEQNDDIALRALAQGRAALPI
ncbi:pore-forming ESAT-6 family protein [Microbacterium sp. NPDC087665]|uniref:pore-forming ESAT-6 family protein n=1 Tax=Microbacterium sp. NPDC087665 TaxID=3364194 RepID=UPI0038229611